MLYHKPSIAYCAPLRLSGSYNDGTLTMDIRLDCRIKSEDQEILPLEIVRNESCQFL